MQENHRKRKLGALQRRKLDQEKNKDPQRCIFTVQQYTSKVDDGLGKIVIESSYTVSPQDMWEAMKNGRHRQIEYEDQVYRLQDTVFLFDHRGPRPQQRAARILEIRISDEDHGFIRVFYLLPKGEIERSESGHLIEAASNLKVTREQAARELIATNQMDIVNATALQSIAHVQRIEGAGDVILDGLWWRHKWKIMPTNPS